MVLINTIAMQIERKQKGAVMERLTQTSNSGGVAFTFDSDITCQPSEARKILNLATKLKDYEDAEEQGRLVKLPCKDVYFIIDINNPKYAMVMKRPIRELAVYEIEDIDKEKCKYFSTKEKAEAKLKELRGGENER